MEIIYGINKPMEKNGFPVVTLGVFDGIHRGHLRVINKTVNWAKEKDGRSIVMTFNKNPKVVLGVKPSSMITSLEHRLNVFESLGVDCTVVMEFNDDVSNIAADKFVEDILYKWIGIKGLVLGYNCSFGKDGTGDKGMVYMLADKYGYEVFSCEPVKLKDEVISSTLVRNAVMTGDLKRAEEMLGRAVTILGTVVSGSQRGGKVLFPTANLDLHHEVMPPRGVYGTSARLNDKDFYAITNIGMRPTFEVELMAENGYVETVVEVHMLDFEGSIYGQDLEVKFLCKIRDEKKFDSANELKTQIEKDRQTFLEYVKTHGL